MLPTIPRPVPWKTLLWNTTRIAAIALIVLSFLWQVARGECPVP